MNVNRYTCAKCGYSFTHLRQVIEQCECGCKEWHAITLGNTKGAKKAPDE